MITLKFGDEMIQIPVGWHSRVAALQMYRNHRRQLDRFDARMWTERHVLWASTLERTDVKHPWR
jgi:hypothetical protein